MRIIDISVPLHEAMVVWPGHDRFERKITSSLERGDMCNLSEILMSVHAGTHVDAPRHFLDRAPTVEQIDLGACIGPCRVVEIAASTTIERADLEGLDLAGVERLLIKTSNSSLLDRPEFVESYVGLSPEAAQFLARLSSLRLVGLDYYSIAPYDQSAAVSVHRAILGRSIIALEGIDLRGVEPGEYELVALPLKLVACDGSPVRAVLIDHGT